MTEPNDRKDVKKTIKRHGHSAAIAPVVIGSALTIAAWGPSSKPRAPSRNHAILAFKRCMRAHGVPMHSASGINSPYSAPFKAARAGCTKLLPGFAQIKAQMLRISKCMRQHGISGSPDPTISLPSKSNPARAIARSGVILAIPSSINARSPPFKHAAARCQVAPKEVIHCTRAVPSPSLATGTPRSAGSAYPPKDTPVPAPSLTTYPCDTFGS